MSKPSIVAPGEGEVVGDAPGRRVEILSDHDALHATWSRFGPGREGADLHVHRRHTDLFYVLAGELTLRLGPEGRETTVPAGTLARVPPLVVHGFRNGSEAELRYLNLHAPGVGFADYLRAMRDGRTLAYDQEEPPPDGGRPASEAVIGPPVLDLEELAVAEAWGDLAPAPPREHPHARCLYVLEGEGSLAAGGREHRLAAGTWARVPAGAPHAVAGRARYLDLRVPG